MKFYIRPKPGIKEQLSFRKPESRLRFGISQDAYLSILIGTSVAPTLNRVMNPAGADGAVEGFLAPLKSTDKSLLMLPMSRGMYAAASKDQKTILTIMLMPVDEAGFDPGLFLRSTLAQNYSTEVRQRIGAAWHLAQIRFESYDPSVYASLDLWMKVATRIAEITEGVVADPISARYLLPEEVFQTVRLHPTVDAREHLGFEVMNGYLSSLGMVKFVLPEILVEHVPGFEIKCQSLILGAAQRVLQGELLEPGMGFEAGGQSWNLLVGPNIGPVPTIEISNNSESSFAEAIAQLGS